jgi:hypothetical protein
VLPIDHPYWDAWALPCGWNCRCTLQSLSQRDIDRLRDEGEDLRFDPPQGTFRNYLNKRTGEIASVPDGIDPGWAYNPGRAGYEARVNQALAEKIADAPRQVVAAAIEERVGSHAFERFVRDPQGSMPVTAISLDVRQAVDHDFTVAVLSAGTMRRQQQNFPDLTIEDYRALPSLGSPTVVLQDQETTFVLVKLSDGRWRYLALDMNGDRPISSVSAYRFATDSQVEELLIREGVSVMLDRRAT